MPSIHQTAIVDPRAELAADVEVGPYTVIGAGVSIDAGTRIGAHCVIEGPTSIGRGNRIWQFASLGAAPQDKKYADEPTRLEIGDNNTIREFCTFNRGTAQDAGVTRVGNDNWIMAYVHLAHDCQVGDHTIFANNAQLAGHVHVGDWAILGGFTVVHQFVRIGAHALSGMGAILFKDLPTYVTCAGNPAAPHGINAEGLKRRGFDAPRIEAIRRAYKTLYKNGLLLDEARRELAAMASAHADIAPLAEFVAASSRGLMR
ncbi:MAG: acyl-ACP--UDP-N-acetylglucosamine O-acyltransferase [Burkholderiales bacterium]|nr:acyl-ACP--UDP-N-acetylglucosamine O-acyltransferase [Burkholderiales bacterium]